VSLERLILSVGAILLAARALGWAFQRIGQPHVVGEMTAGIVLGPSLLGRLFPATFAYLFRSGRHESPKGGNVISNVTETGHAGWQFGRSMTVVTGIGPCCRLQARGNQP